MSVEEIFGYVCFIACGIFYGLKSDDVPFGKALLIGLSANLMALSVFGSVLTLFWLLLMPFGIKVGISNFGKVLLQFCAVQTAVFIVFYWLTRLLRPLLRKTSSRDA